AGQGAERTIGAPVVVAADGRRSTVAFGLGLARHPERPRRWAVGGYFADVGSFPSFGVGPGSDPGPTPVRPHCEGDGSLGVLGEIHVRTNGYIGVAPVPGGATNVCLVTPAHAGDRRFRNPGSDRGPTPVRPRSDPQSAIGTALLLGTLAADPLLRPRFAH